MNTLRQYAVEAVAAVWLIVVAVQFLSRYFLPGCNVDLSGVYIIVLILTILLAGIRVLAAVSPEN